MEVSCSAQPFTELPAAKDITDAQFISNLYRTTQDK
jgi:hypothetical protein